MKPFHEVTEPFWAIIRSGSYYVSGDERSRTNPGHGYPGGYESYECTERFTDEVEFKKRVEQLLQHKEKFLAMRCEPLRFSLGLVEG